ncbi:MAG: hypothetical protein R2797_13585 [Gelidibacter sp.]
MKENVDKQIENLVDKAMKTSALETPSFNFTTDVMAQVESVQQRATTTYQPLISKRVWILILAGFLVFVAYTIFITKPEASGWFTNLDLNSERVSKRLTNIQTPRIAAYGVGLLALMLLVQIPFLKNYFDKRILG